MQSDKDEYHYAEVMLIVESSMVLTGAYIDGSVLWLPTHIRHSFLH